VLNGHAHNNCICEGNKNGNRRTANIRSVGYSDLFVLSKEDLWQALQQYPEAKQMLIERGRQLLRKDNLLDEEKAKRQDMDQISVEEKVASLETTFENVHVHIERLLADFECMKQQLGEKLIAVEIKLGGDAAAAAIVRRNSEEIERA